MYKRPILYELYLNFVNALVSSKIKNLLPAKSRQVFPSLYRYDRVPSEKALSSTPMPEPRKKNHRSKLLAHMACYGGSEMFLSIGPLSLRLVGFVTSHFSPKLIRIIDIHIFIFAHNFMNSYGLIKIKRVPIIHIRRAKTNL